MDLSALRPVLGAGGPFATTHVHVGPHDGSPAPAAAVWSSVEPVLHDLGVHPDARCVGAVEGRRCLVLVTSGPVPVLQHACPSRVAAEPVLDHADLPDVAQLLHAVQRPAPVVVVRARGAGAAVSVALLRASCAAESPAGPDHWRLDPPGTRDGSVLVPLEGLLDQVDRTVIASGADLVAVAGGDTSREEACRALVAPRGHHVLDTGADLGADGDHLLRSAVEEWWSERESAAREGIAEELGGPRRGRVVTGPREVLAALGAGGAPTVVLDLAVLRTQVVPRATWAHLDLAACARDRVLPADRVLLSAAAATGAEVVLLPTTLTGGGGAAALLHHPEPAPAGAAASWRVPRGPSPRG